MLRLAIPFLLWPIIELLVLIRIGQATSATTAILLAILPSILGAYLAKREGLRTYRRIQTELAAGRIPGNQLIEGLLILIAGVLLITPGLITGALGLLILLAPIRRTAREFLKRRFRSRFHISHFADFTGWSRSRSDEDIVDVPSREVDQRHLGPPKA